MSAKETRRGIVLDWDIGLSGTGSTQIGLSFDVPDGVPEDGGTTWYGSLGGDARQYTEKSMRECGWDGVWGDAGLDKMKGREVQLVYISEEYQGKWTKKIKFINGGGGVAMKNALSPEEKAKFFAVMKSGAPAAAYKAPAPRSAPPASNTGAPPIGDDDLPF